MSDSPLSPDESLVVSVVVFKTPVEQIESVLEPFAKCSRVSSIIVMDNFGDRSLERVCCSKSWIYQKADNVGFGVGHNIAHAHADVNSSSSYIAIVNPDLYISTDTITECLKHLDDNPDIAILSPALMNLDGSTQEIIRAHPTVRGMVMRSAARLGFLKLNDEFRDSGSKVINVPALHGACFFVRRKFWLKANGFDERYFMYLEDLDLCRQVTPPNKVVYFGEVSALHTHGASSRKFSYLMWIHLKSFAKYFHKWYMK